MIDLLFQISFSNALLALLLGLLAFMVGMKSNWPRLAHLLWVLVLLKLITPPLFNLPVEFIPTQTPTVQNIGNADAIGLAGTSGELSGELHAGDDEDFAAPMVGQLENSWATLFTSIWLLLKPWLVLIWLTGTLTIVIGSMVRVRRFHCLLKESSQPASPKIQSQSRKLSAQFGITKPPTVSITTANICPMVWWVGGHVHVVLPASLFSQLDKDQWQWILAHELAHVRRRDYLVRWLEWMACAGLWWNPIVWWAQRNLRANEELCCDELVLITLRPVSHTYAESIFKAVETLVSPAVRPPAMASEINSGGFLERRIQMILSGKLSQKSSRAVQFPVLVLALLVIPFGLAQAQDIDAVQKRLAKAVKKGEITFYQAAKMMEVLENSSSDSGQDQRLKAMEYERARNDAQLQQYEAESARLRAVARELEHAIKQGHNQRDELMQKLIETEKQLQINQQQSQSGNLKKLNDKEMAMRDLQQAAAKIEAAIAGGHVSKEEGRKRQDELRRKMLEVSQEQSHRDNEDLEEKELRRLELERAVIELKEAIKDGRVSKKDGQKKLQQMIQLLSDKESSIKQKGKDQRDAMRQKEMDQRDTKLQKEQTGAKQQKEKVQRDTKLNKEQTRAKQQKEKDQRDTKLNKEQTRAKLQKEKEQRAKYEDKLLAKFEAAEQKLTAMVKAGKLTKSDAHAKLLELKEQLWGDQSETSEEKRVPAVDRGFDWEGLKSTLEAAVKSGQMTREEANKAYEKYKKQMKKEDVIKD